MTDEKIIALYFARNEQAITETDRAYGPFVRKIALNILTLHEDAEECVSDTYMRTWNSIPPEKPNSLKAFLGKITRNLAISRYRLAHAKKRGADQLLSELDECIPEHESLWQTFESRRLADAISRWLRSLDEDDRALFIRRYYRADQVKELARLCGINQSQMAGKLYHLREQLKNFLETEGFDL